MRITTLALIASLAPAFAACGGEEPPPPQPPPPPPMASAPPPPASATAETPPPAPPKPALADLIAATMKSLGDAFNAHDSAKFAANYATDGVSSDIGFGESHGRDEIAKSIQGFMDACGDCKAMPARVFGKGNVVATDMVFAGTMTGDFNGMKASKKPIGRHNLMLSTFNDDGLIAKEEFFGDGPGLIAQMKGAKDAPPVPDMPTATEMHWAKNTPDEDKLVDWMKTFNDSFNKGDVKAPGAMIAAEGDVTFYFMGGKVVKAGKDLDKFHADLFKAIPKVQFAIVNAFAADGFVVAERTFSGKMTGRMGPVAPTNKDVTVHVAEVLQPTADGKVSHAWVYGNMAELMPMPKAKEAPKDAAKDKGDKGADKGMGKDKGADKGAAPPAKKP